MEKELKYKLHPCPFCGSDDLTIDGLYEERYVKCNNCYSTGPVIRSKTFKKDLNIRTGPMSMTKNELEDYHKQKSEIIQYNEDIAVTYWNWRSFNIPFQ